MANGPQFIKRILEPKIKPKEIFRKIEIIDIVPTIVPFLNISNPSTSLGKPIIEVFEK